MTKARFAEQSTCTSNSGEQLHEYADQPADSGSRHASSTRLKVFGQVDTRAAAFIAQSPFLLVATSDNDGKLDVSSKGDAAGFVWLENESTLWIPDRPGNRLIMGLTNVLSNPRIGLLFIVPGTEETLRINGRAEIYAAATILEKFAACGRPALVVTRIEVEECFFHCAKVFRRSGLWQTDNWPAKVHISFGGILAPVIGGGAKEAAEIDAVVEQDSREKM